MLSTCLWSTINQDKRCMVDPFLSMFDYTQIYIGGLTLQKRMLQDLSIIHLTMNNNTNVPKPSMMIHYYNLHLNVTTFKLE
jgi:hypothetical protein